MNTPISQEQMMTLLERGKRERNAAIREIFTTLPAKALDWAANTFEKFVRSVLVDAGSPVRR